MKSIHDWLSAYGASHQNPTNKILHVIGSLAGLFLVCIFIIKSKYLYIPLAFIPGYSCAWIGHFIFEKNKPATFKYPLFSFIGDWVMLKDILIGKVKI